MLPQPAGRFRLVFMHWYQPVAPSADLSEALVCGWTVRTHGQQLLVPDGCIDVLCLADGTIRVCGPETKAWSLILPPSTEAVGVRFRPGIGPAALATPAAELLNRRVGLDDLLGAAPARRLGERIIDAPLPSARLAILQEAARRWLGRSTPDPLATPVSHALARRSIAVTTLADTAGMTERKLLRRSHVIFGYPPSTLRGILRLQRFMALAQSPAGRDLGLAGLASLAGYSDQAHLSHECRKIATLTPSELLASEAPNWHGESSVVPLTTAAEPDGARARRAGVDSGQPDLAA